MGKEDSNQVRGAVSEPDTKGADRSNSSGASDSSGTGGTGGRGSGGRGTGDTQKEKRHPGVVDVEIPSSTADKEEEKKRKRAERERKRRADAKAEKIEFALKNTPKTPFDTKQIDIIIMTVSDIVGSRTGLEHWILNPQEISQITTPLSSMIAKSERFQNMGEHSDQIALCIACFIIILPRVIMTLEKRKSKGVQNGRPVRTTAEPQRDSGKNSEGDGGHARQTTAHSKGDSKGIFDLIPPTAT